MKTLHGMSTIKCSIVQLKLPLCPSRSLSLLNQIFLSTLPLQKGTFIKALREQLLFYFVEVICKVKGLLGEK